MPYVKPTDPMSPIPKPEILAPAGDPARFMAALAAGADAVLIGEALMRAGDKKALLASFRRAAL